MENQDCWKKNGVWGQEQPRCPKLTQFIHCRNCEIFIHAGRSLLERELPDDYMNEWTRVLAAKKEEESLDTLSVIIFRIEKEWLALPTQIFGEIIQVAPTHTVPHRKNPVLIGIVNVHGEPLLCVSLREQLGIEVGQRNKKSLDAYERMMVINHNSEQWVFPVDEIHGIYRVLPDMFKNVPVTVAKSGSAFTKSIFKWEGRYVAFLDDELLLHELARSVQ